VHVHYADKLFGKGDATVRFTVRNTGNAILSARPKVAGITLRDSPELLPGETWKGTAEVHGVLPKLWVTETVTVIPLLTDAAGSISPLPKVHASGHALAIPWVLLVLVGALIGAALAWRRRRAVAIR
jgi:hypothetical protein